MSMYHDQHEPCTEVYTSLHGPPFQNHMQTDLSPTCLEPLLTALREAVSWAIIPTKPPDQTLTLCIFTSVNTFYGFCGGGC